MGATRNFALVIKNASLDQPQRAIERDRIGEVQVGAGFDQGEIHVLSGRVRHNMGHFGDCEVSARIPDFAGLVVDDPIANAGADAGQVLAWELILLRRAVVVDRVRPMNEDTFGHGAPAPPSAE